MNEHKVTISIPGDLVARADELADRLATSRNQIYRDALAEYLARHEPHAVTRALDQLADRLDSNAWTAEAGRKALERNEW